MTIVIAASVDGPVAVRWHIPEASFEMVTRVAGGTGCIKMVPPVVAAAQLRASYGGTAQRQLVYCRLIFAVLTGGGIVVAVSVFAGGTAAVEHLLACHGHQRNQLAENNEAGPRPAEHFAALESIDLLVLCVVVRRTSHLETGQAQPL